MEEGISRVDKVYFGGLINGATIKSSPRIKIPDFQRNYVWPRKRIKNFLDSIIENEEGFYIGSIVIQNGKGAGDNDIVVDGQQRFVTLFFFLRSILDLTKDKNEKKVINDLLFASPSGSIPRLKFSRKGMNVVFKKILTSKNKNIDFPVDKILKRVLNTYLATQKLVKEKDYKELLKKIIKLRLIKISCISTHNVAILYEGLNSTAKKLQPIELIKSLIINEDGENIKFWEEMEENFLLFVFSSNLGYLKSRELSKPDLSSFKESRWMREFKIC